jgi:magnesium transporter
MIKTYLFTEDEVKEDVPIEEWRSLVEGDHALLWVDARSFDKAELDRLAEVFDLKEIAVKSCMDPYRRPHLHEFKDHFYVNMTTVGHGRDKGQIKPAELNVFVGDRFVITAVKESKNEAVEKALDEYKGNPDLCSKGSMHTIYLLAEDLVETYFPIVEDLDDRADQLEDKMLESADEQSLRDLFKLKRETFELRRLLGPQRDIFNELVRRDFPFARAESQAYFQDVYNRMIHLFDMLDTVREIISGDLDIYLSTVSNRMNDIMKVLTVAATILMTLSLITGFYGMNFVHLPWLESPNAFRNSIVVMLVVTLAMMYWFRRKKWM